MLQQPPTVLTLVALAGNLAKFSDWVVTATATATMQLKVWAPFFTGERAILRNLLGINRFGTRGNAINSIVTRSMSGTRTSLSGSLDEDDDFSKLGSPMKPSAGPVLKLLTEKPELKFYRENQPRRKAASSSSYAMKHDKVSKGISSKHHATEDLDVVRDKASE